jgi:biotin operon repressor
MARRRPITMTHLSLTVLGALLLADGEQVTCEDMALWLFEKTVSHQAIYVHVYKLRQMGCEIASSTTGTGYRLMRVPPDEHLESLLAMLPVVKRSDWWALRSTCPIQRTA